MQQRLRGVRGDVFQGVWGQGEALDHLQRATHGGGAGLRQRDPRAGPLLRAPPPLLQTRELRHRALHCRSQHHPRSRHGFGHLQEEVQGQSEVGSRKNILYIGLVQVLLFEN